MTLYLKFIQRRKNHKQMLADETKVSIIRRL